MLEIVREVLSVADVPLMFVALDIEAGAEENLPGGLVPGPRSEKLDATIVAYEAFEFLEGVQRDLAERAVIYTGQGFHWMLSHARPELAGAFGRWPLWVPSYGKGPALMPVDRRGAAHPWSTWTIHQFTSGGRVQGIRGSVDLNRFRGDEQALQAFASTPRPHCG